MTMPRPTESLSRPIERLFSRGTLAGMDEGQLLDRFVAERDELAFAGLVERLGPMVAGVCRRRLSDPHDVDDAFQATFLVLARKAGSIRDPKLIGPWLFGVAARVATRARVQASRRKDRETPWVDVAEKTRTDDGLRDALDDEIARLPEKYRRPIVLCYLEGLTHDEAADRLRCPVGTVRSRMAWARDRLRSRLTRLGAAVPPGLAAASEATAMSPPVPRALLDATVRLATMSPGLVARNVSAHVLGLSQGVIRTMTITSLRPILVLAASLVLGAGGLAYSQRGSTPAAENTSRPPTAEDAPTPSTPKPEAPGPGARPASAPGFAFPPLDQVPSNPGLGGFAGPGSAPLSGRVLNMGKLVAYTSPAGERISVFSELTGRWDVYKAPEGTKVFPIASGSLILTQVKGAAISQVAAISANGGTWKTQDLRRPVSGVLIPIVGPSLAAYQLGGQVYAYSAEADRWDILDIGPDATARPVVGPSTILVEHGDRLSVFGARTGKWETTDLGKP